MLRNDKEKPKNEQTLEYYIQYVHEELLRDTLVPQFEVEVNKLQKIINELTKKLEDEKAHNKRM